jgi:hypothetical protein
MAVAALSESSSACAWTDSRAPAIASEASTSLKALESSSATRFM